MTDTMNSIYLIFLMRSLTPRRPSKGVLKLAVLLKREAARHAAEADQQFEIASAAGLSLANAASPASRMNLLEIAIWHYTNAASSYERAAARYAEAGCLETAKRREFNRNAKLFATRASASAAAIGALRSTIN